MITVKLWLYNSQATEYKGQELSKYVLQGTQNTENLTEEMDVTELTLQGYPVGEEFAPETKFIVEVYDETGLLATYHRIVEEDVVEQPSMADNGYFIHQITLTEPSAIAQKRIVDNISITYKLKDVSLEEAPIFDKDRKSEMNVTVDPPYPPELDTFGFVREQPTSLSEKITCTYSKYFLWKQPDGTQKVLLKYTDIDDNVIITDHLFINRANIKEVEGKKKVSFIVPAPHIMFSKEGTNEYEDIGIASFRCTVQKTDLSGTTDQVYYSMHLSEDNLPVRAAYPYANFNPTFANGWTLEMFSSMFLLEKTVVSLVSGVTPHNVPKYELYFRLYTHPTSGDKENLHGTIETDEIEVNAGDELDVRLEVNALPGLSSQELPEDIISFSNNLPPYYYRFSVDSYSSHSPDLLDFMPAFCKTITEAYSVSGIPSATNVATGYDYLPRNSWSPDQIYDIGEANAVVESGEQYTALNLIKRAIIASDVYFKESDNASVVDLNDASAPYPFYISNEGGDDIVTASDLALIRVNEAFYHQKNLWEILIEAGKYAHAIPQITFGNDDKFEISFYKLGGTNKKQTDNTPISIMNYRKIDDYVSACSSYVENLVQLGGIITEKVAPKSSSEDYLIDNNNAEIIVSKPILEIISIKATITKDFDETYGSTTYHFSEGTEEFISPPEEFINSFPNFIYEKSVYDILPIYASVYPNKGIAMYYELGDNIIKGGDYQLPTAITNPYSDYSFKKILFCAFAGTYPSNLTGTAGPWEKIKVNDFVFEVTYRTKDNARVEHTRPDLRHYLLSSKHDAVPTHRQFNNQQDILVDSVTFGGSMFGKLIRTGNSNYKVREWCAKFSKVKHKGELYDINGEWYYVARVTNIFYSDHIESVVEYSKDYNQLSEIIGIPSEPRFYEISERSSIDREIAINDYLLVTTSANKFDTTQGLIYDISHTKDLIFGGAGTYLKWARSTLKGDDNMNGVDEKTFGQKDFEKSVISAVSAYSCGNTLTYEWDMVDNFSAGDSVGLTEIEKQDENTNLSDTNSAYRTLQPVQYCDKYGKGTLLDFDLYGDIDFSIDEIRSLPSSPESITETPVISTLSKGKSAVIIKDCREVLHFNYNLMQITDSDTFVLSPFFFSEKAHTAKIVLLSEEVNKMSNGLIKTATIIAENASPTINSNGNYIVIDMNWINSVPLEDRERAKSIVIMEKDQVGGAQKFIIAKNGAISTDNWYLGEPNKATLFTRKQ